MRSFTISLLTAALVALGVSANPSRLSRREEGLQLNPPSSGLEGRSLPTPVKREEHNAQLTNAERFARGLPPLNPKVRAVVGRRNSPSSCPSITHTGSIQARDSSSNLVGYIYRTPNGFGEYGITTDPLQALGISFEISSCASSGPINIVATNGPYASSSNKYVGGIVGFSSDDDDLGSNYNYLYLGGSGQTPAGSPPASVGNTFTQATATHENSESAIWTYVPATNSLSAQWINTDGSAPATYATYVANAPNTVAFTGDLNAFTNTFGPNVPITLTFVPV